MRFAFPELRIKPAYRRLNQTDRPESCAFLRRFSGGLPILGVLLVLRLTALAKSSRRETGHRSENFCEVTLALVAHHRRHFAYRLSSLRQQHARAFQPDAGKKSSRSHSGDLLEEPCEMVFRKISRSRD